MLRYAVFGLIATLVIVAGKLVLKPEQQPAQSKQANPVEVNISSSSVANSGTFESVDASSAIATPQASKPPSAQNEETSMDYLSANNTDPAAAHSSQAWKEDPAPPMTPQRFANKGIDARALKISKKQLSNASVGSQLTLPIPQMGQDYAMSVQEVGRHANGDKTLKGHLINQPDYAVIMTEGKNATFATINTPEGSFLLEAHQEQGWMLAATDLNQLIDPNLPDYQIPDISRTTNP